MNIQSKIRKAFRSKPVIEGAGVHLKRTFGTSHVPQLDPFLINIAEQSLVSQQVFFRGGQTGCTRARGNFSGQTKWSLPVKVCYYA